MKSVPVLDRDTVFINGYNTPFNDPGKHKEIPTFTEVLAKHDANRDRKIARGEAPDDFTRGILPFIDNDRDGSLDAAEWKMYIASMAAENGLLAIRAGGHGDMTARNVKWKYQRAVPQLPSTLLYRGVLYMINDGGILTTFDPATGEVLKQGRLRDAIDHYYASPVAADGKVFIASQTGIVSVLKAGAEQRLRDFLVGRFGGPLRYIEQRGHPRLRMRHAPFPIDQSARDRWMQLMSNALDRSGFPEDVTDLLRTFLGNTATFMINRESAPQ
jgi:hypothetical protein